jgi:hypothetical protein
LSEIEYLSFVILVFIDKFFFPRAIFICMDSYHLKLVYFSRRACAAVELRKKLHGKRFPPDTMEAVISRAGA